jgi:hypothetical protein
LGFYFSMPMDSRLHGNDSPSPCFVAITQAVEKWSDKGARDLWCCHLFRMRFVQGDFVGGETEPKQIESEQG